MDRQHVRQLSARFIAEAEADISYGLTEGLDPHHEYAVLVARLRGDETTPPSLSPQLVRIESLVATDVDAANRDGTESCGLQQLAESLIGL